MSNIRFSDVLNREPLRGIKATAAISLTSTGTTNVLNVSGERGVLKSVSFRITTAVNAGAVPVIDVRIQTDGGTPMDLRVWSGTRAISGDGSGWNKTGPDTTGALDNAWEIDLDLPYNSSCLVALIVTTAASSAGAIEMSAVRNVPA